MTEPTYWKSGRDHDALNGTGLTDDELVAYITSEPWADPLDEGDLDDWQGQAVVRATPQEQAEWVTAFKAFSDATKRVADRLETARLAWEQAQGIASAQMRDAWDEYRPIHDAVERRAAEVEELRRQAYLREVARKEQSRRDAQAAEDAKLGPRTWVTFQPNSSNRKSSPDMLVPVIHLAGCKLTKGKENAPYQGEYRYARKAEVQEVLLAGAPRMERGRVTSDRLFTKLCGRCKPHASLAEALGGVYAKWLDR